MSTSSTTLTPSAGLAFDGVAATYDATFTNSSVGRAQRNAVWRILSRTFHAGDHILELNCGTGEDALHLASHSIAVEACDASRAMIDAARQRQYAHSTPSAVHFQHLSTENIAELQRDAVQFDGVFSNFSGLNCVGDLQQVAQNLAALVRPGASLLLCFSTRFCLIEILYFLLLGEPEKAFRRCWGWAVARVGGNPVKVYYPMLFQLRRFFEPHFVLRECIGIGVAVPPSYLDPWARKHPQLFGFLCKCELPLSSLPIVRVIGDHMLLRFEKV